MIVAPRVENPLSDVESIISNGYARARPSASYAAGGQWVMNDWSDPVNLAGAALTFLLDPLTDNPYELHLHYTTPDGEVKDRHELRIVPTSVSAVKWEDLELRYAAGTDPGPTSDLLARIVALETAAPPSGGATSLTALTGVSTDGKALIATGTSYTSMRTAVGAAPTVSPTFTTSLTAANPTFTGALTAANPTFTGTITIPNGALAEAGVANLVTDLAAKAPLASPALTGNPTAPTATAGDNDTTIATTAFVTTAATTATAGAAPATKVITVPLTDQWATVDIQDDGGSTTSWKNRLEFFFRAFGASVSSLVTYINEYGELRGVPAKNNTVGWRLFMAADDAGFAARSTTVPVMEIADKRTGVRTPYFAVYADGATRLGTYKVSISPTIPSAPEAGQIHILTEV